MNKIEKILNKITEEFSDILCSNEIRNQLITNLQNRCVATEIIGEQYDNYIEQFDEELLTECLLVCLTQLRRLFEENNVSKNKKICIVFRNENTHNAAATDEQVEGIIYDVFMFNIGVFTKIKETTSLFTANKGRNGYFDIGMFCFLFFHEIAHRYNGHQGVNRVAMNETEESEFRRMIEWDADALAATQVSSILLHIVRKKKTVASFRESHLILIYIFILSFIMNQAGETFITFENVQKKNYLPPQFRTVECVEVMDKVLFLITENDALYQELFIELLNELFYGVIWNTNIFFQKNYKENLYDYTTMVLEVISERIQETPDFKNRFMKFNDLEELLIFRKTEAKKIVEEVRETYDKYYSELKKHAIFILPVPEE